MILKKLTPKAALNKAYQKIKPLRNEFENFKTELNIFINSINVDESEEYNKKLIANFFEKTFYSENNVNTKGRTDLAIYLGKSAKDKVGVITEVKHPNNSSEMVKQNNLNTKAMHEVIRYYLNERIDEKNDELKSIVITNLYEWFIFDAQTFERIFFKDTELKKDYLSWKNNKKVSSNTDHFYNEIAKPFLEKLKTEIEFVYLNLSDYDFKEEKKLIPLFKIFSKPHLIKETFANDSNTLNKPFYQELLHIIGLEEVKEGSKKIIRRKDETQRYSGSLLENTITILKSKDSDLYFNDKEKYGTTRDEQLFNIALELNITWINRILFLKLLEAQLVNYNKGDKSHKFLDSSLIKDFDILRELFHEVLAVKEDERSKDILPQFNNVPYLNSSLFDISTLERKTIDISGLKDRYKIPYYSGTVLKGSDSKRLNGEISTLKYLLDFLDAYDFSTESTGDDIQEENKSLINASVLGRIFEKINGYKEGSIFTPGFITMYMSRETIRRAVVQKFNDHLKTSYKDFNDLKKEIDIDAEGRKKANHIINSLKICDPAVGSGHFLVSALNEIIAVKSELKVLSYRDGSRIQQYKVEIENDELIVTNVETDEIFDYHLSDKGNIIDELQKVQEALFHEKETIIENCLFGVDINPNSVNICRLRLWIELLKNAYYDLTPSPSPKLGEGRVRSLQTLPNIDINIKQGNSLISRFALDVDLKKALKTFRYTIDDYKNFVAGYRNAKTKEEKRNFARFIEDIKKNFRTEINANDPRRKKLNDLSYELHTKFESDRLIEVELSEADKKKTAKEKEKLVKQIDKLSDELKSEETGEIYRNAFEWRFEFPEVLDDDGNFIGFDVVIGNPPYIRFQEINDINKILSNYFREQYMVANKGNYDIYVIFIEKSMQLIRSNGFVDFIVPNKFMNANYGESLRNMITSSQSLSRIVDFGELQVFDEATIYTCLLRLSKNCRTFNYLRIASIKDLRHSLPLKYEKRETIKLINKEWNINKLELDALFIKMQNGTIPLKEITKIFVGIQTSADPVYIVRSNKGKFYSKSLNNYCQLNNEILRPVLKGSDIKRFFFNETTQFVIMPYIVENNEVSLMQEKDFNKNYTATFEYLGQNKSKLLKRAEVDINCWWHYPFPKNIKEMFQPKIITGVLANKASFNFDSDGKYTFVGGGNAGGYGLILIDTSFSYKYLVGLLNSQLIDLFIKSGSTKFRGGYYSYAKRFIENTPIKKPTQKQESQITGIVEKIIEKKKENPEADTKAEEKEIDRLVYELYGLTEEEIKIVEG